MHKETVSISKTIMKEYISKMMMVMAAVVAMTFTACGGDSDDEEQVNTGKQRIEMTISGNTEGWVTVASFFGYTGDASKPDQTCELICNQSENVYNEENILYVPTGGLAQRTFPVTVTLEGNSILFLHLQVIKNGEYNEKDVPDITVTLKGYKGSKLTNSFSKTYKSTTISYIGFHADKSDDKIGLEGEESYDI